MLRRFVTLKLVLYCSFVTQISPAHVSAHDHTLHAFLKARQAAKEKEDERSVDADADADGAVRLTINLIDAKSKQSLAGLVRITDRSTGKFVRLTDLIERYENWYAMPPRATVMVPQSKLSIEAFNGLETELAVSEIDLKDKSAAAVNVALTRFYSASENGLQSGNTHLHLMKLTHAEAIRYLEVVPRADALDLVYLSHLRRIPDERHYISNDIVINSLAGGELKRLSTNGLLFAPGEEHRHNFGGYGEGYGHVMFLDIVKLIQPVSIGPGIMGDGTDGRPIQRGMEEARGDGATVVWCHNTFGLEDVPNWMSGLLHAQNIFDGGDHGSYKDSFYRYLNLGLKVPFSTGTDWFIYDFSRVYVPIEGELTSKKWLEQLAAGRSYITNGPFLEFHVGDHAIGDTLELPEPTTLTVSGHAIGRNDFKAIEVIHNGKVIHTAESKADEGHFQSEINLPVKVGEPGWLALRVALDAGNNEFEKQIFAHSSPIYVEYAGRRIFRPEVARELIAEIEANMKIIEEKAKFADDAERDDVLQVHRDGISILRKRLREAE